MVGHFYYVGILGLSQIFWPKKCVLTSQNCRVGQMLVAYGIASYDEIFRTKNSGEIKVK